MADVLDLLQLSPLDAVKSMVAAALKPGLAIDDLTFAPPRAVANTANTTQVELGLVNETVDAEHLYIGKADFTMHRMDLSDFFQGIELKFSIRLPNTVENLLTLLTRAFQVTFAPEDFQLETITTASGGFYTLKAAPTSYRWLGSVQIQLIQPRS